MSSNAEASMPPKEVIEFTKTLESIPGTQNVYVGFQWLEGITIENLSLPAEFALLPHLPMMRSNGGLKNEALIRAEFNLSKTKDGWIGLEFLSWWVRDLTRSGYQIQLRSVAFPPQAGSDIQLGNSLSFYLEIFVLEASGDPIKVAKQIETFNESLSSSINIYQDAIVYSLN